MIPRYSRPDMVSVWEPANKFRIWYLIEAHATQAQADLGTVPQGAAEAVWKVRERMEAQLRIMPTINGRTQREEDGFEFVGPTR